MCLKCNTEVPVKAKYCPNCGVDIHKYVRENAGELIRRKKQDKELSNEKPSLGTGMIIAIIILCILFLPLGLIVAFVAWYGNKKKVEEWQRDQIINKI